MIMRIEKSLEFQNKSKNGKDPLFLRLILFLQRLYICRQTTLGLSATGIIDSNTCHRRVYIICGIIFLSSIFALFLFTLADDFNSLNLYRLIVMEALEVSALCIGTLGLSPCSYVLQQVAQYGPSCVS